MNEVIPFVLSLALAAVVIALAGIALGVYGHAITQLAAYIELRDAQPVLAAVGDRLYICFALPNGTRATLYGITPAPCPYEICGSTSPQHGHWRQNATQAPPYGHAPPTPPSGHAPPSLPAPNHNRGNATYIVCGVVDVNELPKNFTAVLYNGGVEVVKSYEIEEVQQS
jgi:hypothetical protein